MLTAARTIATEPVSSQALAAGVLLSSAWPTMLTVAAPAAAMAIANGRCA